MTHPKHIKVGTVNFTVADAQNTTPDNDEPDTVAAAEIVYSTAIMYLSVKMDEQVRIATVWHECLHAILIQAGHFEQDEQQITALGYGLVRLIRDNPELIAYTTTDNP